MRKGSPFTIRAGELVRLHKPRGCLSRRGKVFMKKSSYADLIVSTLGALRRAGALT